MYMADARTLRLGPNATYIPLTCVGGFALGDTNFRFGVFAILDTNMLVSFALGDAKVWRWGTKPKPVPNGNGFASQRITGFTIKERQVIKGAVD